VTGAGSTRARRLGRLAPAVLALALGAPAAAQGDPGWDVRVAERVEVAAGATAPLSIAIAVDRGLTVSKDAAVILDLAPDPGASVKKRRLGRGDAVDPDADAPRFVVPVRGDAPGNRRLIDSKFTSGCERAACARGRQEKLQIAPVVHTDILQLCRTILQ